MESIYDKVRFYKLGKHEKGQIIRELKKSFDRQRSVSFAVVFGSLTRRNSVRDVDVCVYSVPTLSPTELLKLNAQVELDLGFPVDLVELTYLSPSLRIDIIRNGIQIKGQRAIAYQLLDQAYHELMSIEMIG